MARERDVRLAIQQALLATGAFSGVYLSGLPEDYGFGVTSGNVCVIDPDESKQTDWADATESTGLRIESRLTLWFYSRDQDPQARDEAVERLLNVAADALNGVNLVEGFTMPDLSRFISWKFMPPAPPERKIKSVFSYQYLVDGWDEYDTSQ